jgi:predicted GNAT family acetyltransferase
VGEAVVRQALDTARSGGFKIIPTCPFVKKFLERHPDYQDVVARR